MWATQSADEPDYGHRGARSPSASSPRALRRGAGTARDGSQVRYRWYTPMPIPRRGTKISSLIGFAATECAFGPVGTFSIQVSLIASMTPNTGPLGLLRAAT